VVVSARDAASAAWSSVHQLPAPDWLDDASKRARQLTAVLTQTLDGTSWPQPDQSARAYDEARSRLAGAADLEVAAIGDLDKWMAVTAGGSVSPRVARWSAKLAAVPRTGTGGTLPELASFVWACSRVLEPTAFRDASRQVTKVEGDLATITRGSYDRHLRQMLGRLGEAGQQLDRVVVLVAAGNRGVIEYLHGAVRAAVEACNPTAVVVLTAPAPLAPTSDRGWGRPPPRRYGDPFNAAYEIYVQELAAHLSSRAGQPGMEYHAAGTDKAAWMDTVCLVERDGQTVEVLIDAKGQHAQFLDKHGEWIGYWANSKKKGLPGLMKDAKRQVDAAGGRPVEWWCAEQDVARQLNRDFARRPHLRDRVRAVWKPFPEGMQ
jgi:hypothetical protein